MESDVKRPLVTVDEWIAQMPSSIQQALPQFLWNKGKLWALDIPASDVNVDEFKWLFELPVWQLDGLHFQLKPIDVLARPSDYPEEYQRILNSDLNYPIQVTKHHTGRLTILDGFHRVAKAMVNGDKTIRAVTLSPEDIINISITSKYM